MVRFILTNITLFLCLIVFSESISPCPLNRTIIVGVSNNVRLRSNYTFTESLFLALDCKFKFIDIPLNNITKYTKILDFLFTDAGYTSLLTFDYGFQIILSLDTPKIKKDSSMFTSPLLSPNITNWNSNNIIQTTMVISEDFSWEENRACLVEMKRINVTVSKLNRIIVSSNIIKIVNETSNSWGCIYSDKLIGFGDLLVIGETQPYPGWGVIAFEKTDYELSNVLSKGFLSNITNDWVVGYNYKKVRDSLLSIGIRKSNMLCDIGYGIGEWNACDICNKGFFSNVTGYCEKCPINTYQNDIMSSKCDICTPGSYTDDLGQTSCIKCSAGTYLSSINKRCIKCDYLSYSEEGSFKCIPCGDNGNSIKFSGVKCSYPETYYFVVLIFALCVWFLVIAIICFYTIYAHKKKHGVVSVLENFNENALEESMIQSNDLLQNILPLNIVKRLKKYPNDIIADRFDDVTVLFVDVVGFTEFSEKVNAIELVTILGDLFCEIDKIRELYGVEKIKTIGDCYMAASGITNGKTKEDSAISMANFACDLITLTTTYELVKDVPLNIRIGINTGSVVAGVIERIRFCYDVWGDTVNIASRMESTSPMNQIQVTSDTKASIPQGMFKFKDRGTIRAKGTNGVRAYILYKSSDNSSHTTRSTKSEEIVNTDFQQTIHIEDNILFDSLGEENSNIKVKEKRILKLDVLFLNTSALPELAWSLCKLLKLDKNFGIEETTFFLFITDIVSMYNPCVSYHNIHHALDVCQMICSLLVMIDFVEIFTPLEVLTIFVASLCHDIGHPGQNNAFQTMMETEHHIEHGPKSTLEKMHITQALSIISNHSTDSTIGHGLSRSSFNSIEPLGRRVYDSFDDANQSDEETHDSFVKFRDSLPNIKISNKLKDITIIDTYPAVLGHIGGCKKTTSIEGIGQLYNKESMSSDTLNKSIENIKDKTVLLGDLTKNEAFQFLTMFETFILATDMSRHKEFVDALEKKRRSIRNISSEGIKQRHREMSLSSLRSETPENLPPSVLLGCIFMKAADIGNISRPFDISCRWAIKLQEEFWCQGDHEKLKYEKMGIKDERQPMFIRGSQLMETGQIGFITYVGIPFFEVMKRVLPLYEPILSSTKDNLDSWERLESWKKKEMLESVLNT